MSTTDAHAWVEAWFPGAGLDDVRPDAADRRPRDRPALRRARRPASRRRAGDGRRRRRPRATAPERRPRRRPARRPRPTPRRTPRPRRTHRRRPSRRRRPGRCSVAARARWRSPVAALVAAPAAGGPGCARGGWPRRPPAARGRPTRRGPSCWPSRPTAGRRRPATDTVRDGGASGWRDEHGLDGRARRALRHGRRDRGGELVRRCRPGAGRADRARCGRCSTRSPPGRPRCAGRLLPGVGHRAGARRRRGPRRTTAGDAGTTTPRRPGTEPEPPRRRRITKGAGRPRTVSRSASLLLEAAAEPLLHAPGEAALVLLAASWPCRSCCPLAPTDVTAITAPASITRKPMTLSTGKLSAIHSARTATPSDEQYQTEREDGDALEAPTAGRSAQPATTDGGYELGVLGVESTLDLIEQSLLVLGEGHGFASGTTRSCRVIFHGAGATRRAPGVDVYPKDTSPAARRLPGLGQW